ncbi:uncharacterized protein LOC100838501 [Brachypodium distachyon]|uniref:uncharacterized protein LOC100838501 n=1 Tax=Brachypodium distachyon TaxID=15368 RepID=UPI0001C73DDD|nr:uncharacterized protein LOC100838501 [Brachypodium distachyon]|eukprot:XP_003574472.1 uncharacterized protein LOC100838501 [Brachypodium distachyon]
MAGESRGNIAFFATYRPPVPLDIFSSPVPPSSSRDEVHLTDGVSYNYDCRPIPASALKALLRRPKLAADGGATEADVDAGRVSGLVFVSERDGGLETLRIALRFDKDNKTKVFSLADVFGSGDFSGTRLEDSGCFGGGYKVGSRTVDHSLIYVSTKEPVKDRRSPWTVVYKTNLRTGKTERLTPKGAYDLSPAVSPSGKKVAVASFRAEGWQGEIENLKTDIFVMNVEKPPLGRKLLVKDGGWPSWGSENFVFFHRGSDKTLPSGMIETSWAVFRLDVATGETVRVTPEGLDAFTPAAISETKVAVATIRQKSKFSDVRVEAQYRHIEIFDVAAGAPVQQITQKTRPKGDHYNPFVLDGGARVGYHRVRSDLLKPGDDVPRNFHKLESPLKDVGLFRVSGVFPTISKDGSKLAFVDNEFKAVWVADSQGLRIVHVTKGPDSIFSTMWNQNPDKDVLYVCKGPSFNAGKPLEIHAIPNVSSGDGHSRQLTKGKFNNAFPSSSPDGTRFVFRSTRDHAKSEKKHKNLYIMEDQEFGEYGYDTVVPKVTRLTDGEWTDTHCQWSPSGDWIVFSSTRDKPATAAPTDHGLDPGYFAVFMVKASDPTVVIRVVGSGDDLSGHVNHPVFSPDGRTIAVTADLAAVSADPISLPLFLHSVRPYGDIFAVDIDDILRLGDDVEKLKKIKDLKKKFHRITHSRYEYSTPEWTMFSTDDPNAQWNVLVKKDTAYRPTCPYAYPDGGESWHMTGHLCIPKRCC